MTDPDSPRHRNLGFFLIWRDTPGVTIIPLRLLNGINQNFVIYDNVRVPANHLIGGDHQGWQVTQTVLEAEHGSARAGPPSSAATTRGSSTSCSRAARACSSQTRSRAAGPKSMSRAA